MYYRARSLNLPHYMLTKSVLQGLMKFVEPSKIQIIVYDKSRPATDGPATDGPSGISHSRRSYEKNVRSSQRPNTRVGSAQNRLTMALVAFDERDFLLLGFQLRAFTVGIEVE
jgi:hypothetical protein